MHTALFLAIGLAYFFAVGFLGWSSLGFISAAFACVPSPKASRPVTMTLSPSASHIHMYTYTYAPHTRPSLMMIPLTG